MRLSKERALHNCVLLNTTPLTTTKKGSLRAREGGYKGSWKKEAFVWTSRIGCGQEL